MNAQHRLVEAAITFLERAKECERNATFIEANCNAKREQAAFVTEAQTWLSAAKYLLKE